jgi:glycosyltransferase involved in cell wall biosynthesis
MNVKVAIIDDLSQYSWKLIHEGLIREGAKVTFYGPIATSKMLGREDLSFKSKRVWGSHSYPIRIFRESLKDKPDVVHIQYEINTFGRFYTNLFFPFLLLLLRSTGSKTIITVHAVFTGRETGRAASSSVLPKILVRPVLLLFYKLMAKFVDMIVVHNSGFKSLLVKYYGIPATKINVVPHGVSTETLPTSASKSNESALPFRHKRVILCFGVLSPRKGLEYLIEAYAKVVRQCPKCVLVVAGDEPVYYKGYKRGLQALVKALGIERGVAFTGYVGDEVVRDLFSLAEIVVLPYVFSVSASGPLSTAMQHHKPIVATRTVYFNSILEDGKDALLVTPKSSEELAEAIRRLLTDSSLRTRLIENIGIKADQYSWRRIARTTIGIYEKLLNSK